MIKDIKKCKFCKTEVEKSATICFNCKKDLRSGAEKHPILISIFIIVIVSMIGSNFSNSNTTNTNTNTNNIIENKIISGSCSSEMEKEIANEYKSPSTVKFISCNWDKSKGIFGEADAQNGFGGTIRTSFLCNGNSCLITEK